ncbi:NADP-dependent oxidoreductase [Mesorhizobium huakuii]|uniref:NADP-dependent oxidoreductase n=1 Tax=Mesorhizobium huakuii TaxID=28104 RepID=UPI001FD256E4|nr:NADP-dependent oxidoreductase [Mesorhizobium huakuii]
MRAVTQNTVGGPDVLIIANQPAPSPKAGEVLVRVKAAGINPVDGAVRGGYYPLLGEPPFILGWDISGTVEALGTGVTGFKVGDEVFGMPRFPKQAAAYAELAAVPADEIALKPKAADHIQAGALPLAGLTAWQGLVRHGALKSGQRVLVHAAAGGVGHLAVQIAKARGAYVIATASRSKLDFVRRLGADEVIDYTQGDFTSRISDIDLVLDPMGGSTPNAR